MPSILTSIVLGLLFGAQSGSVPGLQDAPRPNQILAEVNGAVIKASDVEALLWDVRGREILDDLIYFQIAKSEADAAGVVLTDQEIAATMAAELKAMERELPPGSSVDAELLKNGQTRARLYLSVKTSLLVTKLALKELDPAQYVRISTIVYRPKSSSATDLSEAITTMNRVKARLRQGEPWAKLVDEIVEDAEGRRTQGYVGWRKIENFPETLRESMKKARKGDLSEVVQTASGIQLFRIDGVGAKMTDDESAQMKEELKASLTRATAQRIYQRAKIKRLYPAQTPPSGGV